MIGSLQEFWHFITGSLRVITRGGPAYFVWVLLLLILIVYGVGAYAYQANQGLIVTNMRDQVSWGFYIGNFTFLVGVAAAAVVLVIPAYVYDWGPFKEVVLIAELLAVAAIIMCMAFVTVDIGRPERLWHLAPGVGTPNFPYSLLTWDIFVLNAYFVVNLIVVTYLMFKSYRGRPYSKNFILPLIFLSIPLAICIHTVTAFLFVGLVARPFWNTAILAPRFLASAFCSGPALLVIIFRIVRSFGQISIPDSALAKIGELLAYAMAVNLFLLGAEVFKDFYFDAHHSIHAQMQWFGAHGRSDIAVYTWLSLAANVAAFVVFVVPVMRHEISVLTIGCVLAIFGIYIEKGMGLLLPGLTPDVLGEVYAYTPSMVEVLVGAGIWGLGALSFTLMVKVALAINVGEFRARAA
ncbi:MAG: polysulfide reductase NrfD [Deltaproteobacteria bacterium]|nr:polysulfide reductase NrfD [Deltaproteobacteria bacterium]